MTKTATSDSFVGQGQPVSLNARNALRYTRIQRIAGKNVLPLRCANAFDPDLLSTRHARHSKVHTSSGAAMRACEQLTGSIGELTAPPLSAQCLQQRSSKA